MARSSTKTTARTPKKNGSAKVRVTLDHIENGAANDRFNCPTSRATTQTLDDELGMEVKHTRANRHHIAFSHGDKRYKIPTPKSVAAKIVELDETGEMAPFSFTLDLSKAEVKPRQPLSYKRIGKHRATKTAKTAKKARKQRSDVGKSRGWRKSGV